MILDEISRLRAYASLHPGFLRLTDYLEQHDLTQAPTGRIVIDGEQLFINVDETTMKTREEQLLEVHRRYIDVHFPLSGTEVCGWSPLSSLSTPRVPYDAQLDRAFYPGPHRPASKFSRVSATFVFPTTPTPPSSAEAR